MKLIDNLIANYFYVTYKNRVAVWRVAMINSMLTKFNLLISYQNIQTGSTRSGGRKLTESRRKCLTRPSRWSFSFGITFRWSFASLMSESRCNESKSLKFLGSVLLTHYTPSSPSNPKLISKSFLLHLTTFGPQLPEPFDTISGKFPSAPSPGHPRCIVKRSYRNLFAIFSIILILFNGMRFVFFLGFSCFSFLGLLVVCDSAFCFPD